MPDYPIFYPANVWAQTDLAPLYGNATRFLTKAQVVRDSWVATRI
jgi:uncharacterized protein Usg